MKLMDDDQHLANSNVWPELVRRIRARTPARIFVDRGAAYSTLMQLELRKAHAGAVDAVWAEFDLAKDVPKEFTSQWKLFEVNSRAESKSKFLLRPELGRQLAEDAGEHILRICPAAPDVQIVIGDGLSTAAVAAQVPALLPALDQKMRA